MPKIRLKRGLEATIPQLALGEPGLTKDTKKVFIGSESGNLELAKQESLNNVEADLQTKINQVDTKTIDATNKAQSVEDQFNRVVAEAGSNNPEVVQARGNEVNLNSRLNKVDASLAQKANQVDVRLKTEKIYQEDLSPETLSAMTGQTALNLTSYPKNGSVTAKKTDFVKIGKNFINKDVFTLDYSLNVADGQPVALAGWDISPFVSIDGNTAMVQNKSAVICFYDASQNFISGLPQVTPYAARTFTTPANAAYFRTGYIRAQNLGAYQVELGSTVTTYEAFKMTFDKLVLNENAAGQLNMVVPFGYILNGRQITVDWTTKKISGDINVIYYDTTSIVPATTAFNIDILMNNVSWLYLDLNDRIIKTAAKGTIKNKFIVLMEIYATTSEFYYFSPYRPSIKLLNYTGTTLSYLQGQEILDGTIEEGKLSSLVQSKLNASVTGSRNLYTLNDAFVAWKNGEKFPIAFYGDSTTDGVGTTGWVGNVVGQDSTNNNAYPKLLENDLRTATGNNVLRIYNAGFSGRTADFGVANFEAEFTGAAAYSDVKMIGISWGINDRVIYTTPKEFRDGFKADIVILIDKCFANNIQPFLLTTQAVLSPDVSSTMTQYPMRDGMHIETIANEVKRELAKTYNLELIDVNELTDRFLQFSTHSIATIIPDKLHFGDVGHKYEANLFFASINPQTIWVEKKKQLDYANQKIVSGVPEDKVTVPASPSDSFKTYANYIKGDTTDTLIYKVYVFINAESALTLKAYKSDVASLTYVKVDGVNTNLDALTKTIGTLDLGLHTLEVYSGASDKVDFKGFVLE